MDKRILWWLFMVLAVVGWVMSKPYWASLSLTKPMDTVSDTTRVTVVDTIPYYKPVARDSVVVRYELAKLPINKDDKPCYASLSLSKPKDTATLVVDSVSVEIPIMQKRYEDSTYTAWVSGCNPTLDSIYVYPRHETVTIINTIRQKPRRWGIGVSAGYAITPYGAQPYIGVGVQCNLFTLGKRR